MLFERNDSSSHSKSPIRKSLENTLKNTLKTFNRSSSVLTNVKLQLHEAVELTEFPVRNNNKSKTICRKYEEGGLGNKLIFIKANKYGGHICWFEGIWPKRVNIILNVEFNY